MVLDMKIKMGLSQNELMQAHKWFAEANSRHWWVARLAYKAANRQDRLRLASAINRHENTVDSLKDAYTLFRTLVLLSWQAGKSSQPVVNLWRKRPEYTRWQVVYQAWIGYEFEFDEAMDWLENFDGGNDALGAELANKHGAPEWERRANTLYREAVKLSTDTGTPLRLVAAAEYYVNEFDACFAEKPE